LQITQDDENSLSIRQPAQFLVEQGEQISSSVRFRCGGFGHLGYLLFPLLSPGSRHPRLEGGLVGHAVEPVGDHLAGHDRVGLADQDEEGGLEIVLGIMTIPQDAAADTPHHRPMPPHQRGQGVFTMVEEVFQELAIGPSRARAGQHGSAQVLDDLTQVARRHPVSSWGTSLAPYSFYYPHEGGLIHDFL
jgi:hypothetical protein